MSFFIILNFIFFDNKKSIFLILPRPFYYNYLFQIISINILLSKINSELATIFTFNQKHQMSYVLQKYLSFSDFRLTLISDFKDSKKKEVFDKFFKEELRSLVLKPSIPLQNVWLSNFKFPQKFIDALEHSGLVIVEKRVQKVEPSDAESWETFLNRYYKLRMIMTRYNKTKRAINNVN